MVPRQPLLAEVGLDHRGVLDDGPRLAGGEDAAMIQKSAKGVPAVNIGVPTRYGHSQSGVIDRADYDHTVELVVKMIERLTAQEVASLREF